MKAWLHRRQKSTWVFEWSSEHDAFVHTTSRGTTYLIKRDHWKPFWVGRISQSPSGARVCYTCENELRATFIDFENGGRYYFPGGKK
jgi:hypothetical protein